MGSSFVASLLFALTLICLPSAETEAASTKALSPQMSLGPQLTLDTFLSQVSTKNQGYQASAQTAKAARLSALEGILIYRPLLTGSAHAFSEGQQFPSASDDRFGTRGYNLGVAQQTPIGFTGKVVYNESHTILPAAQNPLNTSVHYDPSWFSLDFTQSLFRNFAGRELNAQAQLAEGAALARAFAQTYQSKLVLLEAESTYWSLALARENVQRQAESLERAQKLQDWTSQRVRIDLADRSEALQASTFLQTRKLDLRTARDGERVAAQAFNSARGVLGSEVPEQLVQLSPELIATFNAPTRSTQRDDIKAAEYQARSSAANALLNRERNKPTVEIFGSIPLTEPEAPEGQASFLFLNTIRPGTTIGLKLTAPLDVVTQNRVREGYAAEAQAADSLYQRRVFEEERDWQDLTAKFQEAKERLQLFVDLEKTQYEKLVNERDRQHRGRSTIQQVILFETDYQNAQLGRLQTLANLLTLNAQMKLYGVSYSSD